MTDKILAYMDDKYQFVFTPSQEGKEKAFQDELALKLKNGMSINESRSAMGLPKLKGLPDIPGNSDNLIQYLSIQSKLEDPEGNTNQQMNSLDNPNKDKPSTMDKDPQVNKDPQANRQEPVADQDSGEQGNDAE